MGNLGDMINQNEIELHQFFKMHPYSASEKVLYDSALKEVDFFKEFYVKNNKTYGRLATVCNVINNKERNLVVITGYRGCGKTNFLRLIKYISDGKKGLETLEELRSMELDYAKNIDELKKQIQKDYKKTIAKIRTTFFNDMYGMDDETVGKIFVDYISERMVGKCKYINFDEGGMGREKPFSTKLFFSIRSSIEEYQKKGRFFEIINLINGFVVENRWIIKGNFEEIDFSTLEDFWENLNNTLLHLQNEDFYEALLDEFKKLTLEQLLFVYIIWDYAGIIISKKDNSARRLIYLLDNIDIISDGITDIFINTMMGIWKFMWDTRNVFAKIREKQKKGDKEFVALYDKTSFIVAMRETTAMHISGHLRDKMRQIMDHFDMSVDVDKTMVMQRKIDYALRLVETGEIKSTGFIKAIECLNKLISDRLYMRNLFQLFNNDYRTAVMCITTICIEHINEVTKAIELMDSDNASLVFGGRGIIYRLIIDGFFEWDYFDAMGIPSIKSKGRTIMLQPEHGYSCARILLTILCNTQSKRLEHFFVNPEESVRLAKLYSMVSEIMSLDEFVNIIDGMYSLRNKRFWNHLVTFDNILAYSPDIIKDYIGTLKSQAKNTDIYIRATFAGQIFASIICVHFEYFASRYAAVSENVPLFLLDNLDDTKQWNSMKKIVDDVYGAVEKCNGTLEKYNRKVLRIKGVKHYDNILGSPYYYERQFHEERIIHNQISYLEAYRTYLFEMQITEERLKEANTFLLNMIRKYLDLLKYNRNRGIKKYRGLFFSTNSKNLYNELSVCMEEIQRSSNVRNGIAVTRDYYMNNYKGKKCNFMQQMESDDELI